MPCDWHDLICGLNLAQSPGLQCPAIEVELRLLAVAEGAEEGDQDIGVVAGVARVGQGTLVAVLAPVHGDVPGTGVSDHAGNEENKGQNRRRPAAPSRHFQY
jgi:hypothetical protein